MAAAVKMSQIDTKTTILRRGYGLLPHDFRHLYHAVSALLPDTHSKSHDSHGGLGAFVLTQGFYAHCVPIDHVLPTTYGEKPLRVVQMDMAWHNTEENVGVSDISATIHGRKSGHKRTNLGAYDVAKRV